MDIAQDLSRKLTRRLGDELRHGVDVSFKVYSEDDYARKQKLGTPFMKALRESSIPL